MKGLVLAGSLKQVKEIEGTKQRKTGGEKAPPHCFAQVDELLNEGLNRQESEVHLFCAADMFASEVLLPLINS